MRSKVGFGVTSSSFYLFILYVLVLCASK